MRWSLEQKSHHLPVLETEALTEDRKLTLMARFLRQQRQPPTQPNKQPMMVQAEMQVWSSSTSHQPLPVTHCFASHATSLLPITRCFAPMPSVSTTHCFASHEISLLPFTRCFGPEVCGLSIFFCTELPQILYLYAEIVVCC